MKAEQAKDQIRAIWSHLRVHSDSASDLEIPSQKINVKTEYGDIRAAIGLEREIKLMIPISADIRFPDVKTGEGLIVKDVSLLAAGIDTRFIDLSCREPALESVFLDVADEIVRRIADKTSPTAAVEGTLKEFRVLLIRVAGGDATRESAAALIGELLVLRELLNFNKNAESIWTGPGGGRHDFLSGNDAIEVKTSLRAHENIIEISALDQLLPPPDGILHLSHMRLEPAPDGALTVPVLVSQIRESVTDTDDLDNKLAEAGYSHDDAEPWEEHQFNFIGATAFRVEDGFPRLVPSDFEADNLPQGVSHIRYRVNLASAAAFRLTDEERISVLRRLSGEA